MGGASLIVTVRRSGDELLLDPPYGPADRLLPQDETRFMLASKGTPVEMRLGPDGRGAQAIVGDEGQTTVWRRLP